MTADRWIVTGYDGSENSRDGLALAAQLAAVLDLGVTVEAVMTFAPSEATWAEYGRMLTEEETRLEAEARSALAAVHEPVDFIALPGASPARELHDLAESRSAELIVIGSTHRGPIGRVMPGTVADRLLTAAPCPVAVAPAGYRDGGSTLDPVVVAFDASPEAQVALELGTRLAGAAGTALRLLAIADPHDARVVAPGATGWAGLPITEAATESERRRLTEAVELAIAGLSGELDAEGEVIVDPEPRAAIVERTAAAGALLTGSRGYGPLGRVLLGGTASGLVREAQCPVIVTPRSLLGD